MSIGTKSVRSSMLPRNASTSRLPWGLRARENARGWFAKARARVSPGARARARARSAGRVRAPAHLHLVQFASHARLVERLRLRYDDGVGARERAGAALEQALGHRLERAAALLGRRALLRLAQTSVVAVMLPEQECAVAQQRAARRHDEALVAGPRRRVAVPRHGVRRRRRDDEREDRLEPAHPHVRDGILEVVSSRERGQVPAAGKAGGHTSARARARPPARRGGGRGGATREMACTRTVRATRCRRRRS